LFIFLVHNGDKTNWGANHTNEFFWENIVQVTKTILKSPYLGNMFQHIAKNIGKIWLCTVVAYQQIMVSGKQPGTG
jgi:hypothetical protein